MKKLNKSQLKSQIGKWIKTPLWKEFNKKYMRYLQKYTRKRRQETTVYPNSEDVFRALRLCGPRELKVVILGQNPYHDGSADGLAFSNGGDYQNVSPSLQNIFKEIDEDLGFQTVQHDPDLSRWAEQGVLLLNTSLTVEEGESESHLRIPTPNGKKKLWQRFTKKVIRLCSTREKPTVFMLWGNHAKSFVKDEPVTIDPLKEGNRVLQAYHPIAENYQNYDKTAFFDCQHFSKSNEFLSENNIGTIDWYDGTK